MIADLKMLIGSVMLVLQVYQAFGWAIGCTQNVNNCHCTAGLRLMDWQVVDPSRPEWHRIHNFLVEFEFQKFVKLRIEMKYG